MSPGDPGCLVLGMVTINCNSRNINFGCKIFNRKISGLCRKYLCPQQLRDIFKIRSRRPSYSQSGSTRSGYYPGVYTIHFAAREVNSRWRPKGRAAPLPFGNPIALCLQRAAGQLQNQDPATIIFSIRIDPVWILPRRSTSLPTCTILRYMSARLPATVISSTGYWICPCSIHNPAAPRE